MNKKQVELMTKAMNFMKEKELTTIVRANHIVCFNTSLDYELDEFNFIVPKNGYVIKVEYQDYCSYVTLTIYKYENSKEQITENRLFLNRKSNAKFIKEVFNDIYNWYEDLTK